MYEKIIRNGRVTTIDLGSLNVRAMKDAAPVMHELSNDTEIPGDWKAIKRNGKWVIQRLNSGAWVDITIDRQFSAALADALGVVVVSMIPFS